MMLLFFFSSDEPKHVRQSFLRVGYCTGVKKKNLLCPILHNSNFHSTRGSYCGSKPRLKDDRHYESNGRFLILMRLIIRLLMKGTVRAQLPNPHLNTPKKKKIKTTTKMMKERWTPASGGR